MDYTSPDLAVWLKKDIEIEYLKSRVESLELQLKREKNKYANYKLRMRIKTGDISLKSDEARKLVNSYKKHFDGSLSVCEICREISNKTGLGFQGVRSIWYRG